MLFSLFVLGQDKKGWSQFTSIYHKIYFICYWTPGLGRKGPMK